MTAIFLQSLQSKGYFSRKGAKVQRCKVAGKVGFYINQKF